MEKKKKNTNFFGLFALIEIFDETLNTFQKKTALL